MHSDAELDAWISAIGRKPYLERRVAIRTQLLPAPARFLYKYRALDPDSSESIKQLREILVESKLWLSAPLDFNDPFDTAARIVVRGDKKDLKSRIDGIGRATGLPRKVRKIRAKAIQKIPKAKLEKDLGTIYERSLERMGVHCFAGDPRSILLWSHYANNHKGLCIQFERAHDFPVLSGALRVEYSDDYPIVNWLGGFGSALGDVLLKKSLCWKYEEEERLIVPERARRHITFRPEAVTGIIYGCRMPESVRQVIEDLLEERSRAHPLPAVYRATKHQSKYALRIRRVTS